jgi:LysR family transcriptional regulator, nitrogen assimilation regulatory protein
MSVLTPANMRAFAAVVEESTFTAAAARLNATQSGISQQVARLERSLGVSLLVRNPQGVIPTPAGRQLYRRCIKILRDMAAAEDALRNYRHGVSGSIRIGLMPAMTRSLSGPVQRRLMVAHPNVRINLTELVSSDLIDEVTAGRIDFGIVPAFNAPDAIRIAPIGSTREVLVHRGNNHKDHMREVALTELPALRLILQSAGNIRREAILARLKADNVEVVDLLDLDSMFGTLEFIENSDYATILPAIMLAPEIENARLCVRPIRSPPLYLDLIAIEPASRVGSPIAQLLATGFNERVVELNATVTAHCRE